MRSEHGKVYVRPVGFLFQHCSLFCQVDNGMEFPQSSITSYMITKMHQAVHTGGNSVIQSVHSGSPEEDHSTISSMHSSTRRLQGARPPELRARTWK